MPVCSGPAVLIVEDEPIIRMVAALTLADAGYDVIEAAHAAEAVRILEGRDDLEVVFTDIRMPGTMDGLGLAVTVRHRWPLIGIIITSAHFLVEDRPLPPRCHFLDKPYAQRELIAAFHDLAA